MVDFYIIITAWVLIQTSNSLSEDKQMLHIILSAWIFLQFLSAPFYLHFTLGEEPQHSWASVGESLVEAFSFGTGENS